MDSNESRARALLGDLSAGCSAVAWETADGGHLWGRNFDFNRIAADSKVTFVPRGQVFYACGTELEGNLEPSTRCTAAYAAVGIGSLVLRSTPALYEGLNEKGLMGGQLYYRTFAHFAPEARPGTLPLQPPFLVTWCLATCASVEEVARALEERVSLVAIPMLGTVPPIHWMFSDRTGESIVVESDRDGLHIYRNTVGVMTNSPGYPWHRTNLLNYPSSGPWITESWPGAGSGWSPAFPAAGRPACPGTGRPPPASCGWPSSGSTRSRAGTKRRGCPFCSACSTAPPFLWVRWSSPGRGRSPPTTGAWCPMTTRCIPPSSAPSPCASTGSPTGTAGCAMWSSHAC